MGAMSANVHAAPPSIGVFLPNILTQLGELSDPLLPTILGFTGPFAEAGIPILVPLASAGLGGLLATPLNFVESLPLGQLTSAGNLALPGLE